MEHCPNCRGQLIAIAATLEQPAIGMILTHREVDLSEGSRTRWLRSDEKG